MSKPKKFEKPTETSEVAKGLPTKDEEKMSGKRSHRRGGRGRRGRSVDAQDLRRAGNDPKWYLEPNRPIVESVSRFAFNLLPGYKSSLPLGEAYYRDSNDVRHTFKENSYNLNRVVPGVIGFNWMPFLGSTAVEGDPNSAMNQAAINRYAFIRHANSGSSNYEAADLQLVTLAAVHIYSLIEAAKKVYGLIPIKKFENGCLSDDIMLASGWDPLAVRMEGAKFLYLINDVITRMMNVWVPGNFPIIHRWSFLGKALLMDEDNERCQFYTFRQNGFYRYDPAMPGQVRSGGLEYVPLDGALLTPETWYREVITAIERITADEDAGLMWGDCLKAYGSQYIYKIDEIPADYRTAPEYDPVMLTQIENAWIGSLGTAIPNIIQYLSTDPRTRTCLGYATAFDFTSCPGTSRYAYLYSNSNDPSVEEICEMTRFAKVIDSTSGDVFGGSEWLLHADMYSCGEVIGVYTSVMTIARPVAGPSVPIHAEIDEMNKNVARICQWSHFNKAPKLYIAAAMNDLEANEWTYYYSTFGELYNAAAIDVDTIKCHFLATSYNLWNSNAWGT